MSGFVGKGSGLHVIKGSNEVLDHVLDYSTWLGNDTLQSVAVSGENVTVDSYAVSSLPLTVNEEYYSRVIAADKAAIVWLSGGVAGVEGQVTVSAVTVGGRTKTTTFKVVLK